jgi:hypothetical protein
VVPSSKPQYAEKTACADETSSVWDEHSSYAELPSCSVTTMEFWFFLHAHVASCAALPGHSDSVWQAAVSLWKAFQVTRREEAYHATGEGKRISIMIFGTDESVKPRNDLQNSFRYGRPSTWRQI